jgi:hypothetical protein
MRSFRFGFKRFGSRGLSVDGWAVSTCIAIWYLSSTPGHGWTVEPHAYKSGRKHYLPVLIGGTSTNYLDISINYRHLVLWVYKVF